MKLHIKKQYYKHSKLGREPIRFTARQPEGKGTDVHGIIWMDPILKKRRNADLRRALVQHEMDEIQVWGKGSTGSHTTAKSREPELLRRIGGVSGFWKEIARRNKEGNAVARPAPNKFNPQTMKFDKKDSKVIYDSTRNIEDSLAFSTGYVLIGVKDNPSVKDIKDTIEHEKSHIGEQVHGAYEDINPLERVQRELRAYSREKSLCSPRSWNGILPTRIRDFMRYISWLSKTEQAKIKPKVKRILSSKKAGGNTEAIQQARADLSQWWLDEEPVPARYARSTEAIRRDISKRHLPQTTLVTKQQAIKPGICYTNRGRLSRKPHKGWRRVKFT